MNPSQSKALQGIDTIIVRVSSIQVSKIWYTEKLDLKPIWEDDKLKLIVFDTGGPTSLTLWQTDKKIEINKETTSFPIFKTEDAFAAKQILNEKGVETSEINDDEFVKSFTFQDPDGNVLEACEVLE
jgi:catechol 2,3-dioxygenase-like lactoylglutathione lyase family enzyme